MTVSLVWSHLESVNGESFGLTFPITVNEGAKAQIHCPQLAWKKKKSMHIKNT